MELDISWTILTVLWALVQSVHTFTELPKFSQMRLLYPGYVNYGGQYHDYDLLAHIGAATTGDFQQHPHNTAALRLSWTLNRYSGRHSLGTEPVYLSHEGRDSFTGKDGQEYIFRNTAFGPYLALKYGNPTAVALDPKLHAPQQTVAPFQGKQGIIRFVSYHRDHAGGHIALWDCDHFYQSRDWTREHHVISVEFWETPDSYCPPKSHDPVQPPQFVTLRPGSKIKVIARHNFGSSENDQLKSIDTEHGKSDSSHRNHGDTQRNSRARHRLEHRRRGKPPVVKETLWAQEET